jgi:hypothetical protein
MRKRSEEMLELWGQKWYKQLTVYPLSFVFGWPQHPNVPFVRVLTINSFKGGSDVQIARILRGHAIERVSRCRLGPNGQ